MLLTGVNNRSHPEPIIVQSAISGSAASGWYFTYKLSSVQTVASSGLLINALTGSGVPIMPISGALSACKSDPGPYLDKSRHA